jgi:amidase
MTTPSWQGIANGKRSQRQDRIPTEWRLPEDLISQINETSSINVLDVPTKSGILTAKELEITGQFDAVTMLEKIASRELTSYEVALAFCKRAAIAQQVVRIVPSSVLKCHYRANGETRQTV